MAESIQGIKVSALPEATQTQLTDTSVTIVDDGTTTRKTKLSTFVEWLKGKIIKNTLTQASTGYALDAYQGKLLKDEVDKLNSAIKWSDWKLLGTNKLGIELCYRYNAYEVELRYKGTLKTLGISGGSEGYIFPSLPEGLNPAMNIEYSIYACAGDNNGKLALVCYPAGTPSNFRISSHSTLNVSEEYICGTVRYTRG